MVSSPSYYAKFLTAIETDLKTALDAPPVSPPLFYRMLHYHMGWVDSAGNAITEAGGKRIRPLLCLLCGEASSGGFQPARPVAAAIEMIHNFSLLHDDVQDQSPLRRNRPTVWKIWGVEQAINAGDALFTLAHLAVQRLASPDTEPALLVRALALIDTACLELTRGQHLDLSFERHSELVPADYLDMIQGKTAALLSLAARLGALMCGAGDSIQEHYAQFGQNIGMAFQIQDDILDIWGDPAVTGKEAAIDIYQRKKSLPVIHALEQSEELRLVYSRPEPFDHATTRHIIQLLDQAGSRAYAEALARQYSDQTLAHLDAAAPQGEGGEALRLLAQQLLQRAR